MDDFSNHLSAKDASRNSKNAAWGGTFAQPKVWVSFVLNVAFSNDTLEIKGHEKLNIEQFKLKFSFSEMAT